MKKGMVLLYGVAWVFAIFTHAIAADFIVINISNNVDSNDDDHCSIRIAFEVLTQDAGYWMHGKATRNPLLMWGSDHF